MTLEEKLLECGCEEAVYLSDRYYDDAAIGCSEDGRVVYDYDSLISCLMKHGGVTTETDAIEWVDYNIIGSLPYYGDKAPIIIYRFIE